jgi:predicted PurR-regulated permease PerM
LLLIAAALAVVGTVMVLLADIVVPVLVGLVLCALLMPLCTFLQRHRWPAWAAITAAWLLILLVMAALGTLLVWQVMANWSALTGQISELFKAFQVMLSKHPLGLSHARVNELGAQASQWLQEHAQDIGLQTWIAGRGALHFITGTAIAVLVSVFLLWDGKRIWRWVVCLFPHAAQQRLDAAGRAGWQTLVAFPRVQVLIAAFDAMLIGLGALILGVPLALPVATLVFFGALIPIAGAIATGLVAVALALLANGWIDAVLMLAIVLAVNQLESHVVQPLLAGNAFKVHPLVVVLGVLSGIAVGGIAGAFFAVPLIAIVNAMIVAAKSGGIDSAIAPRAVDRQSEKPAVHENSRNRRRRQPSGTTAP